MLLANALWNYAFFRLRSLRMSFLFAMPYNLVALALLWVLFKVDRTAAWWFVPYAVYLIYANAWGYALLRKNAIPRRITPRGPGGGVGLADAQGTHAR